MRKLSYEIDKFNIFICMESFKYLFSHRYCTCEFLSFNRYAQANSVNTHTLHISRSTYEFISTYRHIIETVNLGCVVRPTAYFCKYLKIFCRNLRRNKKIGRKLPLKLGQFDTFAKINIWCTSYE